jgi:hypothetical protein
VVRRATPFAAIARRARLTSMMHCNRLFLLGGLVALGACSDPASTSQPVGIELKAKSGDAGTGAIAELKDITTESGNPYGAFVADARAQLGGHDPSRIELPSVTLTLGGQSTGVARLEDVFTGDVDVAFVMNTSSDTYDVAHLMNPAGVGPTSMDVVFDSTKLSANDWPLFLGGQFKVVLRGTPAAGFAQKGADASLQVTFGFDAFQ